MTGSNAGTGQPITFMCSVCRVRRRTADGRWPVEWGGFTDVALTGRWRRHARGGVRTSNRRMEYRCGVCGHLGWSNHRDLERKFIREIGLEWPRGRRVEWRAWNSG